MKYKHVTKAEFDAFEKSIPNDVFWQTSAMALYKESQGCSIQYVGVVDDSDQILCASCIIGYATIAKMHIFQALRGFLIDYNNAELLAFFLKNLKADLAKQRGVYLRFNPYVAYKQRDLDGNLVEGGFDHSKVVDTLLANGCSHDGFTRGFDKTTEPRWMMVLDLEGKDEDTLFKEMNARTRRSIRRGLRYPIELHTCTPDEFGLFADMLNDTGNRRGFDTYPLSYYKEMTDLFGQDVIQIVMSTLNVDTWMEQLNQEIEATKAQMETINPESKKALRKKEMLQDKIDVANENIKHASQLKEEYGSVLYLSGAMFVWYKEEAIYLLGASNDHLKQFQAPHVLQWLQIKRAVAEKKKRYNFYGTSGIFESDADDYGVYEFKKGFNAHAEELIGDFRLTLNDKLYHRYHRLKKIQSLVKK